LETETETTQGAQSKAKGTLPTKLKQQATGTSSFRFRNAICTKQRVDTEFGTDLKLPSEF
jgi:hypothetical protein